MYSLVHVCDTITRKRVPHIGLKSAVRTFVEPRKAANKAAVKGRENQLIDGVGVNVSHCTHFHIQSRGDSLGK